MPKDKARVPYRIRECSFSPGFCGMSDLPLLGVRHALAKFAAEGQLAVSVEDFNEQRRF